MNILIISSMYPPINKSNQIVGNMSLHYMARQWVRLGHNVTVFPLLFHKTPMPQEIKEKFSNKLFETKADNVELYIKEFKLTGDNTKVGFAAKNNAVSQYTAVLKKIPEPDVLIVHSPLTTHGIVEKLRIKCPKIAVLDFPEVKAINHGGASFEKIESEYDAIGFSLKSVENKIKAKHEVTKPSFVSSSGFPNFNVPEEFTERVFMPGRVNLLVVGELTPEKKLDTLINALSTVKNRDKLHLSIIGLGPMEPALRRIIVNNQLENTVTFLGAPPRFEIFNAMRHCDCFVMTCSPKIHRLVYLEAMSQGCIPVSAYDEHFEGIITDGVNGLTFEEGNEKELSEVLDKIAEFDVEKLKALSVAAVETAESLSEDRIAKRDIELIEKILADKKK